MSISNVHEALPASCAIGSGAVSRGYSGPSVALITHPYLAPRLSISSRPSVPVKARYGTWPLRVHLRWQFWVTFSQLSVNTVSCQKSKIAHNWFFIFRTFGVPSDPGRSPRAATFARGFIYSTAIVLCKYSKRKCCLIYARKDTAHSLRRFLKLPTTYCRRTLLIYSDTSANEWPC